MKSIFILITKKMSSLNTERSNTLYILIPTVISRITGNKIKINKSEDQFSVKTETEKKHENQTNWLIGQYTNYYKVQ